MPRQRPLPLLALYALGYLDFSTSHWSCSALVGSTVDTSLRQSTVALLFSAQCLDRQWIQISVSLRFSFVFRAMLGSTVDTNLRQFTELFRISALCLVQQWIHIYVSLQRPGLWFRTAETAEYPQLQFIDGRRFSWRGADADSHGHAVQQTTETSLLLLNTVIHVPVARFVQVGTSAKAPCVWQSPATVFGVRLLEYRIMKISGRSLLVWFPYAALIGSTVDTCLASVYEAFWNNFTRFIREDHPCRGAAADSLGSVYH